MSAYWYRNRDTDGRLTTSGLRMAMTASLVMSFGSLMGSSLSSSDSSSSSESCSNSGYLSVTTERAEPVTSAPNCGG